MFPVIFTLTLERSSASEAATSGLLCMAIVGGAFLPSLAGKIADELSLRDAYVVPLIAYLCISAFGFAASRRRAGRSAKGHRGLRTEGRNAAAGRCRRGGARRARAPARLAARGGLPLWSRQGYDRVRGGFAERLTRGRSGPRRCRAAPVSRCARCTVFANAASAGLARGSACRWCARGLSTSCAATAAATVSFARCARPTARRSMSARLLYDQAFVLLALAESHKVLGAQPGLRTEAEELLAAIRRLLKHAGPGFDSGLPERLPLLANPHMHLLEAALAWRELGASPVWAELVAELEALALSRLIDAGSGALLERFGADWRPLPGIAGPAGGARASVRVGVAAAALRSTRRHMRPRCA